MSNKIYNSYWFDFGNNINNKLPLTYDTLKICKLTIDNIEQNKININIGTKNNPIIFNNIKQYKNVKNNLNSINNYEIIVTKTSLFYKIKNYIKHAINTFIQHLYDIKFKLEIYNTKLNFKHYYNINDNIYVSYKESLILFKSKNKYLLELQNINNVKKNFLYRSNIYEQANTYVDSLLLNSILKIHLKFMKYSNNRFKIRLLQTNWGFYIKNSGNNFNDFIKNNFMSGIIYIWNGIRYWIIGLTLSTIIIYYFLYIRLLPFNKIIFSWILLIMFIYWIISGFVFFIKKYQYSRFTSSIQRFWKRTYIIFWLIEASLFLVFFYLTINATSEPVYMYDQIKVYKSHLFSWRWFLIKLLPSVSIIILGYYLQLTLKWNTLNKQNFIILLITLLLIYILWLEFYQFYHILNFYNNINWLFDYDEYIWSLELDARRTRLTNNYISICLFAKFWHFIFIFIFWVFFVLRVNELNRVRYPLLVANIQNFIIIYIMSWVYMYPWFKFIFRKYLDINYYWFYTNSRELGIRVFFTDIKLFFLSLIEHIYIYYKTNFRIDKYSFFYWIESSTFINYDQYRKFIIKDIIIKTFNSYII